MKQQYITPAFRVISLCTLQLLAGSGNEYSGDQGLIHFDPTEIIAEEGD